MGRREVEECFHFRTVSFYQIFSKWGRQVLLSQMSLLPPATAQAAAPLYQPQPENPQKTHLGISSGLEQHPIEAGHWPSKPHSTRSRTKRRPFVPAGRVVFTCCTVPLSESTSSTTPALLQVAATSVSLHSTWKILPPLKAAVPRV